MTKEEHKLRDHFAGLAMQGLMNRPEYMQQFIDAKPGQYVALAGAAYRLANAMMNERNNRQGMGVRKDDPD